MEIPAHLSGLFIKTKLGPFDRKTAELEEMVKFFPGSYLDVIHGNNTLNIVVVFGREEDYNIFKLKYGEDYV